MSFEQKAAPIPTKPSAWKSVPLYPFRLFGQAADRQWRFAKFWFLIFVVPIAAVVAAMVAAQVVRTILRMPTGQQTLVWLAIAILGLMTAVFLFVKPTKKSSTVPEK